MHDINLRNIGVILDINEGFNQSTITVTRNLFQKILFHSNINEVCDLLGGVGLTERMPIFDDYYDNNNFTFT